MVRILYLNPTSTLGGAERCLLELMRSLPRERYEMHVMLPAAGPIVRAAEAAGARVVVDEWPRLVRRTGRERGTANRALLLLTPFALVPAVLRVARYARRHRIDVIHTNGTKSHVAGSAVALLTRKPLVWHLRDVLEPGPLRFALVALGRRMARAVIANSDATAAAWQTGGGRARLRRIYDGIDLDEFTPRPADGTLRDALGISPGDFVVGTVGALAPLKGHVHLIRAMPQVLRAAPEARLLIVGDEMYETLGHSGHRALLEQEAARLDLGDRVIFAGRRDDVRGLYPLMDVVALGSVRPESFGRVLVEAMASERPVIATALGGPKEIISGPDYGILVPPGDSAALAAAIVALHADRERRRRMGRSGRIRVAEAFSLERNVAAIAAIYDDLVAPSGTSERRGLAEAAG